ncbi:MAG: hypothetical protein KL840_07980 [Aquamicrobium sp.]|nr:hypothetical protein [Aquamicrobium sp.]
MPTFFFAIDNGRYSTTDPKGLEFSNEEEAFREAIQAITEMAVDEAPDGNDRTFRIVVLNAHKQSMFECELNFKARRLSPN